MSLIGQYQQLAITKRTVNVQRCNRIERKRKLRLASFVAVPKLVKGFHNRITASA